MHNNHSSVGQKKSVNTTLSVTFFCLTVGKKIRSYSSENILSAAFRIQDARMGFVWFNYLVEM